VGIWQIIQLMLKAKKYTRGGILGIGVLTPYRGKGISKALAMKLYAFYESKGHRSGLYYPVNEGNKDSRGFAESIGGKGRMTYQVYDKQLV
jgi:GNAT superfamily N-acetyltransferase